MRRMIMTAVASVSLAAPGAALAHGVEHHSAGERHHHHRGHHRHAHVLAFHAQAPASSTSGAGSPGSTTHASEDKAGTVASFTGGVLTITLNDGSTVSGKVSERTEIECPAPPSASAADFSGHESGDDNGIDERGDDVSGNDGSGKSGPSDDGPGDTPGDDDNGNDDNGDDAAEHCTSAALVPGASVKEALLSVGGEGATWVKVEL
jgi:hypothetical protein